MKIVKFTEHYRAVQKAKLTCSTELKNATWYLDFCEDEEDKALAGAEKAEENLAIIREEKNRLSGMVDKEEAKHREKYRGVTRFDLEWEFRHRSVSVGRKVVAIIY